MRAAPTIIREYQEIKETLDQMRAAILSFLGEILEGHDRSIHEIKNRVKSHDSLIDKVLNKSKVYSGIFDVTDLIGFRITTYYESDIPPILKIINKQFKTDEKESVNKLQLLNPDQFGYLSVHRILHFPLHLRKKFDLPWITSFRFELQIRTILQHVWEHNSRSLDYDNPVGLPQELKRKLYRIAALLELADQEFTDIKDEIQEHIKLVLANIDSRKFDVSLNAISLSHYVANNKVVRQLDRQIAKALQAQLEHSGGFIELLPFNLKWLEITSLRQITAYLEEHQKEIMNYAVMRLSNDQIQPHGICIWYMCYHKVCKSGNIEILQKYIRDNAIEYKPEFGSIQALARSLNEDFVKLSPRN